MPRAYRYVIFAAFGWAILTGASQPEQHPGSAQQRPNAKAFQPTPAATFSSSLKLVDPSAYVAPCKQPKDHERCDLEAQWKAANAADKAAWWAVVQSVLSAAGIIGLIYSLALTRRATKVAVDATADANKALAIAERNADAAAAQTALMERSFRVRERPYIMVRIVEHDLKETFDPFLNQFIGKTCHDFEHYRDIIKPRLVYRICNYGSSAAIIRGYLGVIEPLPTFKGHHPSSGGHDSIIIPPGGESENIVAMATFGTPESTSSSDLFAFHGNVSFSDVFGTSRMMNFLYLMLHAEDSLSHVHTQEKTYHPSDHTWRPTEL